MIVERTRAGLEAAKAKSNLGGRPSKLTAKKLKEARRLRAQGQSYAAIAKELEVGQATVRRALAVTE